MPKVENDGVPLHRLVEGCGPTLVPTCLPEKRGHGLSGGQHNPKAYTPLKFATDIGLRWPSQNGSLLFALSGHKLTCRVGLIILVATLVASASAAKATDQEDLGKALPLFVDTARQLCASVSAKGSDEAVKASGDIKVGLAGLSKKLADMGVSAKADGSASRYEGVLREDLVEAMKGQDDCRTKIFTTLVDLMFPGASTGKIKSTYSGYQPTGDFETELRYFFELTGAREMMEHMYDPIYSANDDLITALTGQKPFAAPGENSLTRATGGITYDDLINLMIPIYKKHFTVAQIQELNKFYSTPAMRALSHETAVLQPELTAAAMQLLVQRRAAQILHRHHPPLRLQ